MGIKINQIPEINKHAEGILKQLKAKHPPLLTFTFYSSRFGQSQLSTGLDLVKEFPKMFSPETEVEKILKIVGEISKKEIAASEIEAGKKKIDMLLALLEVKDDVFCEIRFEQINYELVERLKKDPLLDQQHTHPKLRSLKLVILMVNDYSDK